MSSVRAEFERLLDAHLAGELAGEELRRFEAMLAADRDLRTELELQSAISAALRERHTLPTDFAAKALAMADAARDGQSGSPAGAPSAATRTSPWARRLGIAAMLVLGVFGAWRTWEYIKPQPTGYREPGPWRAPETVYHDVIAAGFEPEWVCENDEEFLENVRNSLGQELLVDQSDPSVRVLGIAYANSISPWTVLILSYVDGQPVVVFADRLNSDRKMPKPESPSLSWHKREVGNVVLYELSPFAEPRVLPLIYEPAPHDGGPTPTA
jgi:hypothetical protein